MFEQILYAGWGDMDFNAHMRNTAFLDKSADVRMMFFALNDFPMSEFIKLKLGPVVMKDEVEYFKEVQLMEKIRVTLSVAGLSEDGSRFILQNTFLKENEKLAAKVLSTGGWLDLKERKLTVPPPELLKALYTLDRTDEFITLPSSVS